MNLQQATTTNQKSKLDKGKAPPAFACQGCSHHDLHAWAKVESRQKAGIRTWKMITNNFFDDNNVPHSGPVLHTRFGPMRWHDRLGSCTSDRCTSRLLAFLCFWNGSSPVQRAVVTISTTSTKSLHKAFQYVTLDSRSSGKERVIIVAIDFQKRNGRRARACLLLLWDERQCLQGLGYQRHQSHSTGLTSSSEAKHKAIVNLLQQTGFFQK